MSRHLGVDHLDGVVVHDCESSYGGFGSGSISAGNQDKDGREGGGAQACPT